MSEYIAPQNAKQELVCKAMEKVLRRSQVGISDDFFNLGADAEAVASLAKLLRGFGVASADIMNGRTPEVIAGALCDMTELYRNTVQGRSRAPLTDSQLGIYLECVANPESTMYNNPIEVVLSDATDCSDEDIKQKIDGVLRLHPALYARFEVQDDTVYMVREPFPKEGICKVCNEIDFSLRPFELNAAPLCRCSACRKGGKLTVFIEAHHTVEDGTSVAVLIEQIAQAFAGLPLEEEKVDAFSIYEAEQAVLHSGIKPKADAYFEALLSDVDTDAGLLPDFKSDNKKLFPVRRFSRMLDTAKAERLSDGKNITKSTLFMGVFGYTMLKYAGSESTVISAAETGRRSSLLDHTVSMFVRTLPVVIRPDEKKTGTEFLRELQVQFNDTFAYDFVSYGDLARTYGINADNAFVYQSSMFADETVNGISVDVKVREYGHAFAKLSSSVLKSKDGYELRIDYRSDLYTEETLDGFAQTYQLVLDSILDDVALKDIRLVNEEQENKLDTFNSTLPLDKTETFVKGFKRNYIKYGEKTALVFKDRKYTYLELNDITDRLAVYLHRHGIGRDAVVSILIPRCDYMAILSLAVLKAGGIYEPLDPNYPPERLNFMCKDARTRLLIAERSLAPLVSEYEGEILYLDEMDALLAEIDPKEAEQIEEPTAEDTYVLLYTSGTTGTPKGCMLTHRNIMSFIDAYTPIAEITSDSKTTSYASYGFDAHMADLYPSLYNGCELHIIPDEIRLNFPELKKYFEENGITNCCMTTQVARQFASEYDDVKDLKYLVAGGEKLIPYPLNDSFHIINAYGPTECTICVTMLVVDREYDDIPIGKPMPNNHIFVVDKFGRRLPVGAPGELIICGPQVGKGYLNRREQTEKVFVPNTYEEAPDRNHQNCYKTGDIVRYLPDGNIQFIGRRDLQVKIRGYRIELSEVEKVIRDYPAVTDATVIAVDDHGGKAIHAYFVAREPIEISDLEKFIKSKKPAYMVPAASMQLERIPLTVNQKVDKRKLPLIETASKPGEVQSKREMTDIEKAIVEILKDIVGDGEFGVEADFESLGITSISSIKLATKIYKKFGVNISSASILDGGTILSVENIITASLLQSKSNNALEEPKKALRKYPLTQVQMGIYLDCMRAGMGAYNIPLLIALPEGIDKARLKQAIQTAVKAHPSLLCHIYADGNGDVAVYPVPDMAVEVYEEECVSLPPQGADFKFEPSPLFHISLLHNNGKEYLYVQAHHIVADGESITVLLDDINKAYCGESLAAEAYSVFELSLDEQNARKGEGYGIAKRYYDSVFKGVSADYLPVFDRNEAPFADTIRYAVHVSPKEIEAFCQKHHVTKNIFFTAVFALTLAKFTSHEEALFSTVYNGRTDPRTERLVGMLVKTLPVFVSAQPERLVSDFLKQTEEHIKQLRKYDIFSFADCAEEYGVNADTIFVYQGRMLAEARLGGQAVEQISVRNSQPKAELSAEVYEYDTSYDIRLEYNGGHYSPALMKSFADAYATCAACVLHSKTLGEIEITSQEALAEFEVFNDTFVDIPFMPVYRLFEKQVQATPERYAIIARKEADCSVYEKLTFRQLNGMANAVARQLCSLGISPGSPVALMTERTKEVAVAEYGILKAGCAFLFLSPSYPEERVAYIAGESGIKAIVTTHRLAEPRKELFEKLGLAVVFADDIDPNTDASDLNVAVSPDDLAYLIYTSGSTGKPKGVMVKQKGVVNLADNNGKNTHLIHYFSETSAAVAAFTFDASVVDTICSVVNGMTVCIASENEIHDPVAFTEMCLENQVKSICATPSFMLSLLEYPAFSKVLENAHAVICGGEAFPSSLYEKLRSANPNLNIINGYGPSETTVACTAKLLDNGEHITIGTPLNNYKIYIIDKQNHILPMGALGELVILGVGVGKGYLNRDDLTEKSFITLLGEPAYKSGDLARITHTGEIEFHGRIDNQIKLRGLRIELGEIENAVNSCDGVITSIVTVNGNENNRFLAAYYTAERPIAAEEITAHISKSLAEYMVPRVFIQLDAMPLTANGKINKKELPTPVQESVEREYIAPTGETEKLLCEAFEKALGIAKVGVNDDFFELGGTSLTATKVAMFGMAHSIQIAYKDVFTHPTVRQLARLIGVSDNGSDGDAFAADYTKCELVLSKNVWNIGDEAGNRPLGNILLTGATGFLGMHILKEFLEQEDGDVYCLLRAGSFTSPELKLAGMFIYYFDTSIEEQIGKRIHCIDGDITDLERVLSLQSVPFDTLINCAACVKHFVKDDILDKVNVEGVQNLVELCRQANKRLIHVSTVSVAGEGIGGTPERTKQLHENELYFRQVLENRYIASKFRSEKIVLDAVADGLDGKIMRAGNLMPRYSDGEFQINYMTNGFMRRLLGYSVLGCIPYSQLGGELEFSPIDETASAMLALAKTDRRLSVFHANNTHRIFISDVIRAMNKAGIQVDCVSESEFLARLKAAVENSDTNDGVSGLIAYLNRDTHGDRYMLGYDNAFTADVLNRIGFNWNITSDEYIVHSLRQIEMLGFFDPQL